MNDDFWQHFLAGAIVVTFVTAEVGPYTKNVPLPEVQGLI